MTAAEFETEARSFTAKLSKRQLVKLHHSIEDILEEMHDVEAVERSIARGETGRPWDEIKAELEQQFGSLD